jgi:hypothetical protein
MSGGWLAGLKRFILWDFRRASWQYDVMVGLILAFIFLTPREWFRDQPKPKSVVMLPAAHGASVFWIEPELLTAVPEANRPAKAQELIRSQSGGNKFTLVRLEPIFDAEEEIKGYMVYARP